MKDQKELKENFSDYNEYEENRPSESLFGKTLKILRKRKLMTTSLVVILLLYSIGFLAPVIAPFGYNDQDLTKTLEGPSIEHVLGTDKLGRDNLSRALYALRTTAVITGLVVLGGGLFLGVGLGLVSGYFGGKIYSIIMGVGYTVGSIPSLVLLLFITFSTRGRYDEFIKPFIAWTGMPWMADLLLLFMVMSLFYWVGTARLISSRVMIIRESDYVLAAKAVGASTTRIMTRHILPNLLEIILVGLSASLAGIAGTEVALSFLGIGVQPPHPSFGSMLYEAVGIRTFQAHPQLLLAPAVVYVLFRYAFIHFGDSLIDWVNPKGRA